MISSRKGTITDISRINMREIMNEKEFSAVNISQIHANDEENVHENV